MKQSVLFFLLLTFSIISCQKKENFANKTSFDRIIGKTFLKLEKENGKLILFQPCDAVIPKYIVYKDSIFHHWGQEFYTLKIISAKITNDKLICDGNYEFNNKLIKKTSIIFYCLNEERGIWYINNEIFVEEKNKNKFSFVKETCVDDGDLDHNYATEEQILFLYGNVFLREINLKNILSKNTVDKIESLISQFTRQEDYGTKSFFDRESSKTLIRLSSEQMKIWKSCNQYLDFSDVCSENSLESNWRYPYNQIKSVGNIYNLYKDKSYGDGFESETLKYHIALYMYFLPWNERKKIYEEIDSIKKELSKTYLDFNGSYQLIIPNGIVRENSPELKIIFKISNNKDVIIETFVNNKITDNIKSEGTINDNEFRIGYVKNGQQEQYIIKRTDNNYNISGSSIEDLNPFIKKMDIIKL